MLNKELNILVFSWRDIQHPLAGGAEQVVEEHMKGWIAAGHSVTFFSSVFPGAKNVETIDGIRIIRRGSQYITCHLYALIWYLFVKHEEFDLVVDEFHGWPFFTPIYVRKPKLAIIQELTREVWFDYPLPYHMNYILGSIGYLVEPLFFILYRNVHFMTGSQSAKDELSTVGIKAKNITVIPHGVIINVAKRVTKKEKTKTILFLGALAKDKGIEDAIRTFGLLNKFGNYSFWVVGKGDKDYLKFLKSLVEKEKVKVSFWGYVDEHKKFELLARAHLMINPSIREGWGLVNIEANAMGTPVVAYKSQGLIDSVNDGVSGVICKNNSPKELANNVINILNDDKKYLKLQKGSIDWSKKFNWKKSRKESLDLITAISRS